jgi:outer membrane protein TolC
VDSAYRAYEIAETRVENQLTTQVELKEIRLALNQAQVNYFSAIYDYLSAYFDWQKTVGAVTNTAPSKG